MRFSELTGGLGSRVLQDTEITAITDDSRKIEKGCIFVCVKGERFDGHNAAEGALQQGAACVVTDHELGLGDRELVVEDSRAFYGELCAAWFGHPERKMKFVGVTGTNGKTTTTTVIKQILTASGHKVGLIGTIQNEIGDEVFHTDNTTPMTFELMALYDKMYRGGCDVVVMEVSSFGLIQRRIGPTRFAVAVFTNLTQDHLDYHRTMENYYQAKKMLFDVCDCAIINTDDAFGVRLMREIPCKALTYGTNKEADYSCTPKTVRAGGSSFDLKKSGETREIQLRMTGYFNIANATAALAACEQLGLSSEQILVPLENCTGVKGRCEIIPTGRDFTVICDYAHTPDAVENILENVKLCTEGRLICLFGCGGNRDRTKRPKMAQAAAKYADLLIVTSDNPRDEEPSAIIGDILKGLEGSDVPRDVVVDRIEAIRHALHIACSGDVIVLAGKGHEDYQIFENNRHVHLDEREIVAQVLDEMA